MINIDLADVVTEVRKLAAENPEYVYKKNNGICAYTLEDGRSPEEYKGCLIGQALINTNPKIAKILRVLDDKSCTSFDNVVGILENQVNFTNTEHIYWLKIVQYNQDRSSNWQMAVQKAN